MMIEFTYAVYIVISIAMTIWVARTLSKNGQVFLVDSFDGNETLAESVNHLLVVGFYLLNLGYILLALKTHKNIETLRVCIEFLSGQIGVVLLVLGALHLLNIIAIAKWRNRAVHNKSLHAEAASK
ncbi:MAG: hypothetical protein KAT25_07100 [Sulfuriflexus sp.]|nr:hypothetical protein [Sulfuriflexus sp.]